MKQRNVTSLLRQGMAVIICLLSVMAQQVKAARVEVAGLNGALMNFDMATVRTSALLTATVSIGNWMTLVP